MRLKLLQIHTSIKATLSKESTVTVSLNFSQLSFPTKTVYSHLFLFSSQSVLMSEVSSDLDNFSRALSYVTE